MHYMPVPSQHCSLPVIIFQLLSNISKMKFHINLLKFMFNKVCLAVINNKGYVTMSAGRPTSESNSTFYLVISIIKS